MAQAASIVLVCLTLVVMPQPLMAEESAELPRAVQPSTEALAAEAPATLQPGAQCTSSTALSFELTPAEIAAASSPCTAQCEIGADRTCYGDPCSAVNQNCPGTRGYCYSPSEGFVYCGSCCTCSSVGSCFSASDCCVGCSSCGSVCYKENSHDIMGVCQCN